MPVPSTDIVPPRDGFHTYPHLPLEVEDDTMTTLGLHLGELPFQFHARMNHQSPIPVGHGAGLEKAYPVFSTWGFVEPTWPQAALLAKLAARDLGLTLDAVRALPGTHLVARLLHASFPSEILDNAAYRDYYWAGHLERIFLDDPENGKPCREFVMLERAEAADLARSLAATLHVTTVQGIPTTEDGALLRILLEAAAPPILLGGTAHAVMAIQNLHDRVLREGRAALPEAFLT